MEYQIKIIRNRPRTTIYKGDFDQPYIPNIGDEIWFPEKWKYGETFYVTSVHHYPIDKMVIINVNPKF